MKKTLLFGMLLCLPALTFAQFQLGVKGGLNLSKLTFGNYTGTASPSGQSFRNSLVENFQNRTGSVFGLYARMGKGIFIQPELLYSTRKANLQLVDPKTGTMYNYDVKTSTFDIPLMLGLKAGPLRIMAGPMASFRIDNNQGLGDAIKQYTSGTLKDAWSKAYYGYQVGGGLNLGSFGLDVRYLGNLTDIAKIKDANGQFSQGLRAWQATLSLKLL